MKKILVTGATGLLGSHILRALLEEEKYELFGLHRPSSSFTLLTDIKSKITWVEGDILDVVSLEDAFENIDAVIHCAAMVSFHESDKKKLHQINVVGTANVVNVALYRKVKRLVHISSTAAIGRPTDSHDISEAIEWNDSPNNSHYAVSKYKAELEVYRGGEEGLSTAILNPSIILGVGNWEQSSASIFKKVAEGLSHYPLGVNGFVDAKDVAKAACLVLADQHSQERFIINGDNWSYKKVFEEIAQTLGVNAPQKAASPFLVAIAWRLAALKGFFTRKKPLITKATAKTSSLKCYYHADKFKHLYDFEFTPLSQTIARVAATFLEQKNQSVS